MWHGDWVAVPGRGSFPARKGSSLHALRCTTSMVFLKRFKFRKPGAKLGPAQCMNYVTQGKLLFFSGSGPKFSFHLGRNQPQPWPCATAQDSFKGLKPETLSFHFHSFIVGSVSASTQIHSPGRGQLRVCEFGWFTRAHGEKHHVREPSGEADITKPVIPAY